MTPRVIASRTSATDFPEKSSRSAAAAAGLVAAEPAFWAVPAALPARRRPLVDRVWAALRPDERVDDRRAVLPERELEERADDERELDERDEPERDEPEREEPERDEPEREDEDREPDEPPDRPRVDDPPLLPDDSAMTASSAPARPTI
jgi:hypothetical protein